VYAFVFSVSNTKYHILCTVLGFDSKSSTKCFGDAKGLKFSRSVIGRSTLGWVVTRTNMYLEVLLLSVRKVAIDFYTDPCN